MRIMVTGGAGFIGSHLCERLLYRGKHVAIVDDLDSFYDPALKRANLQEIGTRGAYEFFEGDIRDTGWLREVFKSVRPEAVVHLAARAGVRPSLIDPALYVSVNVDGTVNLLEQSRQHHVKKFVFASSSSVYGHYNCVPFSEDDRIAKPLSVYAATKAAGEALCFTYAHLYEMPVICLRVFTAFGPRQRPDLAIRKFAELIEQGKEIPFFGDGSMARDYTYVSDVVSAFERALESDFSFAIFNLGNSRPIRLDYMVEVLERTLCKKAILQHLPVQPGDMQETYANLDKSRRLLGYEPQVNFEEGMRLFVDWFRRKK